MVSYSEAMDRLMGREKRVTEWEFSAPCKVAMPIKTKIERVQPFLAGVDANGEFLWEGLEMPRWQQEMFRKQYHISAEEFGHFWDHMATTEGQGGEFSTEKPTEPYWDIASKEKIEQYKKWATLVKEFKKKKCI